MTPQSETLTGVIQNYERNARKSWRFYLLTLLGAVFALTPFLIRPARDCVAYPCDQWLFTGLFLLGSLLCAGALAALRRNHEWGSRIDLDEKAIFWRYGPQPAPEHRIDLSDIASVKLDDVSDNLGLWLKDRDSKVLHMPVECVPPPMEDWVAALIRAAPHIRREQVSFATSFTTRRA